MSTHIFTRLSGPGHPNHFPHLFFCATNTCISYADWQFLLLNPSIVPIQINVDSERTNWKSGCLRIGSSLSVLFLLWKSQLKIWMPQTVVFLRQVSNHLCDSWWLITKQKPSTSICYFHPNLTFPSASTSIFTVLFFRSFSLSPTKCLVWALQLCVSLTISFLINMLYLLT